MSFARMHDEYLDPDRHSQDYCDNELIAPMPGRDYDCPCCDGTAVWVGDGWNCPECDFEQEATQADNDRLAQWTAMKPRIAAVWDKINAPRQSIDVPAVDIYFSDLPDGDFEWNDSEAGDWHVYNCGESDCPIKWHKVAYTLDMGRKDGKRFVEANSVDEDGNWDSYSAYDEREGDGVAEWESFYRENISCITHDYFTGWAQYWLDCAETGEDPLNQYLGDSQPDDWVEFCVSSAEDLVKSIGGA